MFLRTNAIDRIIIDSAGMVGIGETANDNMTVGLTINQGTNDDAIFSLKSTDVGHPMTGIEEADTWMSIRKFAAAAGGTRFRTFKDADGNPHSSFMVQAMLGEAADTTKSTTGHGVASITTWVTDGGSSVAGLGADGNILSLETAGTTRFLFDAEGSAHADVEWVAYADHDDLGLIRTMEEELMAVENPAKTERRHNLEAVGVIGKDSWHFEDGKQRAMINTTKLQMLHHGALMQVADRFDDIQVALDAKDSRITALESQINRLEMN
jgi:hypothetical protein